MLKQLGICSIVYVLTFFLQVCAHIYIIHDVQQKERMHQDFGIKYFHNIFILLQIMLIILFIHFVNILVWAVAYYSVGALANFDVAIYFSMVNYTTLGYGDITLGSAWNLLGPIEALSGIIMAGWSISLYFAVYTHLVRRRIMQ